MKISTGQEVLTLVSLSGPKGGPVSTPAEMVENLFPSKLPLNSTILGLELEETYPILSSPLLDATPSPAISKLLLQPGRAGGLGLQPPRLGLSATRALGLLPAAPSVSGRAVARPQALQEFYWRKRLLSTQTSVLDHERKPSMVPSSYAPATTEPVKADVSTKPATLPTTVYSECDENVLSEYQCLVRQQLEFFESSKEEVRWSTQGRAKKIVLGQVGIRCKWCSHMPAQCRSPGAVYYAATMNGLYQAAQNTAKNHLCKECRHIPPDIENRLNRLRDGKRRGPGGKKYWAKGAQALGIYECGGRVLLKQSKVATTVCNNGTA